MKAILMPIRGKAADKFDKLLSTAGKCKTKPTSKKQRKEIVNFINHVIENENSNGLRISGKTE